MQPSSKPPGSLAVLIQHGPAPGPSSPAASSGTLSTSLRSPAPPPQLSQDPRGARAGVRAPRASGPPSCLQSRFGGRGWERGSVLSQHTHRGAWRAWGAFTAFQSKRPLQNKKMWAGHRGEMPPGLGSLQLHPPRLVPHSPLDQEALGPRGSHVALGGHLFQEGQRGLGHPEIRATDQFPSDAQDRGGRGAGRGLVFQIRSGPGLEAGLPQALGFKRNL